jgi:hypothetical protein
MRLVMACSVRLFGRPEVNGLRVCMVLTSAVGVKTMTVMLVRSDILSSTSALGLERSLLTVAKTETMVVTPVLIPTTPSNVRSSWHSQDFKDALRSRATRCD